MKKRRLLAASHRVRVGRRTLATPGVKSMTNPEPVTPAAKPDDGEPGKPTEALSEELIRMIKAAYR
jgi:hypothetical protein